MVRARSWNAGAAVGDSAEGSVAVGPKRLMTMRRSATVERTWASTAAMLSPGRMRKLTTARAAEGRTLSLTPPWTMVMAVVVRMVALDGGEACRTRMASGSKSQRLPRKTRAANGISGATVANDSAVTPAMRAGIGWLSRRARAAARMPMAVWAGGIEEWPPGARTASSRLT